MENHDLVRSQLTLCRGESLDLRDIVALEVHPRFPYAAAITERTGGAGATTSLVVIDLDNHRQNEFDLDGIHAVCWDHGDVTLHVARSTDDATTISRFSPKDGELTDPANVSGVIEGLRSVEQGLLALEAKVGAELSDVHGSGTVAHISTGETWAPRVLPGSRGRRVLRLLDGSGRWHAVTDKNVWEFDARAHALVAVASDGPGEGDWYGAELILVSYGRSSSPYHSAHQLAMPRLSADGKHWSVLAGPASDRGLLLGELIVDGRAVDLGGLHVSSAQWTPEGRLLVVGSHGMETEIVSVDLALSKSTTRWRSADLTSGELEPVVAAKADNDFLVVLEGHSTPPALFGFCTDGGPARLLDTRTASTSVIAGTGGCSNSVTWQSTDGMTIEGQLVLPSRGEVRALVVVAHGGPVAAFRPTWGARDEYTHLLVAAGYAVLQPNPRGSSGRGNSFAERVYGDVGGQDAVDIATGDRLPHPGGLGPGPTGRHHREQLWRLLGRLDALRLPPDRCCRQPITGH